MEEWLDGAVTFLTGRSKKQESFYLDSNRVADVVGQLKAIETGDIESAKEEARIAMSELANACQYCASIDVNAFDSMYDSIGQGISQTCGTIESVAQDIREYSEADPFTKFVATKDMIGTKFAEGFAGAFEGVGDGALSMVGGFCGCLGFEGAEQFFADIVDTNYSKDFFHDLREVAGINKNSMIAEESGASAALEIAGNIGGYVVMGGGVAKVSSLLGSSVKMSRVAGDTLVAVQGGLGMGTESALNQGQSFKKALTGEGFKNAAMNGLFMGALVKGGQLFSKGRAILKGSKEVKMTSSEVNVLERKAASTKLDAKALSTERQALKTEKIKNENLINKHQEGTSEYKVAEERLNAINEKLETNETAIRAKGNEYKEVNTELAQARVKKANAEASLQKVRDSKLKEFSFENQQSPKENHEVKASGNKITEILSPSKGLSHSKVVEAKPAKVIPEVRGAESKPGYFQNSPKHADIAPSVNKPVQFGKTSVGGIKNEESLVTMEAKVAGGDGYSKGISQVVSGAKVASGDSYSKGISQVASRTKVAGGDGYSKGISQVVSGAKASVGDVYSNELSKAAAVGAMSVSDGLRGLGSKVSSGIDGVLKEGSKLGTKAKQYASEVKERFIDSSNNMYSVNPSIRSGERVIEKGKALVSKANDKEVSKIVDSSSELSKVRQLTEEERRIIDDIKDRGILTDSNFDSAMEETLRIIDDGKLASSGRTIDIGDTPISPMLFESDDIPMLFADDVVEKINSLFPKLNDPDTAFEYSYLIMGKSFNEGDNVSYLICDIIDCTKMDGISNRITAIDELKWKEELIGGINKGYDFISIAHTHPKVSLEEGKTTVASCMSSEFKQTHFIREPGLNLSLQDVIGYDSIYNQLRNINPNIRTGQTVIMYNGEVAMISKDASGNLRRFTNFYDFDMQPIESIKVSPAEKIVEISKASSVSEQRKNVLADLIKSSKESTTRHPLDIAYGEPLQYQYQHVNLKTVIDDPEEYIIPQCQPSCRALWKKNIETYMVSNNEDNHLYVLLQNLSDENKGIISNLSKTDSRFFYDDYRQTFGIRVKGTNEESMSELLSLTERFKMQDTTRFSSEKKFLDDFKKTDGQYIMNSDGNLVLNSNGSLDNITFEEALKKSGKESLYVPEEGRVYEDQLYLDWHKRYIQTQDIKTAE